VTERASRRWDTDERGRGIGDASAYLPTIQQLAELAATSDWVTENPEDHLLPGLRRRIEGTGMRISAVEVDPDGVLTIQLDAGGIKGRREVREKVWHVLGAVAELSSHVHEKEAHDVITFDVVTGIPPGGKFATHGHTLRLRVS
jgi:hypothetical protein